MDTTLNISIAALEQITSVAHAHGITRSELITHLIKKVMDDIPDPARLGKMVQYQKRMPPGDWHTFHLSLREDDYEYFLDLRKLFKMSVSLILAYALKKFLKYMNKKNNTDNYTYRNYLVVREIVDGIICWKLHWGFPPHPEKLFPNPG